MKLMQRPSKQQLIDCGILMNDDCKKYEYQKHKKMMPKTRVPSKKLPDLPDAMGAIKRLSLSMMNTTIMNEIVCCKYVKAEDLKYWSNRNEAVDFVQYDNMIKNGMCNDFIAEQMKKNKVAPYWINKFFLSRTNENDLNA